MFIPFVLNIITTIILAYEDFKRLSVNAIVFIINVFTSLLIIYCRTNFNTFIEILLLMIIMILFFSLLFKKLNFADIVFFTVIVAELDLIKINNLGFVPTVIGIIFAIIFILCYNKKEKLPYLFIMSVLHMLQIGVVLGGIV